MPAGTRSQLRPVTATLAEIPALTRPLMVVQIQVLRIRGMTRTRASTQMAVGKMFTPRVLMSEW